MTIRTKRRICEALAWGLILYVLGCVGGADRGWIEPGRLAMIAVCTVPVIVALMWKSGAFTWRGK